MRLRTLSLAITAAGILAVGIATPAPAAEIKKFEGTIAAPAPCVAFILAAEDCLGGGVEDLRVVCPDAGPLDGQVYKFFDLKSDFKHFWVSGPVPVVNEADPSGAYGGTFNEYDLDLHVFDAKCNLLEDSANSINSQSGIGFYDAAKPARFAAVSYYVGPYANIPVTVEASTEKIKK